MAIRIAEPNVYHTEGLLTQILPPLLREGERVSFLCEPGTGRLIVARVRVKISRKRGEMEAKGKKPKRFRLGSTIHPETHEGKRYDCVVFWVAIHEHHIMSEMLEDIMLEQQVTQKVAANG